MTQHITLDAHGLIHKDISLKPFCMSDKEGLRAAANSEETWHWFSYRADGEYFDRVFWPRYTSVDRPKGDVHFVVRQGGRIVGSTCFLSVHQYHKRVEIGGTWYTSDVRGTLVNPVCKYLLLTRAFAWGADRVEWKTDTENLRSRAAIEKLGAQFDGILRNHMRLHDGRVRHTVYYSMLASEWPAAKETLEARIAAFS